MHGRMYAIDELDVCATYLQSPLKFKTYSESMDTFLTFSPYEQGHFDKLYWADKLCFKEKPLPDDFYRFGLKQEIYFPQAPVQSKKKKQILTVQS